MLKINTGTSLMKSFMKNASIETKWAFGGSSPPTSTLGMIEKLPETKVLLRDFSVNLGFKLWYN